MVDTSVGGGPLIWERDRLDWPNSDFSRFVSAAGVRWHVQILGEGPLVLLLHGTGASTHSWRALMRRLASHCRVMALDLPGHGFTSAAPARRCDLPGMATALAGLLRTMKLTPELIVGHSAGAAIGARVLIDGEVPARRLVAINGAFFPLAGLQGLLFPPVARLMAASSLASRVFARRNWDTSAIRRLIAGTGSTLDDEGLALYGRLLRDERHAAGALAMMANWDLKPLAQDLPRLRVPLSLIVGQADRAVPPADARRTQRLMPPGAPVTVTTLVGGGHLIHEECPAQVADLVLSAVLESRENKKVDM